MTDLDHQLRSIVHLGSIAMVELLISRGANLNAQIEEDDGETIFTRAVGLNHDRHYIYELLQVGAKADAPSCNGATPLSLAVMENDFLLVQMLLRAGANPNTIAYRDEEPQTALDTALGDYCVQETKSGEMNLDAIVQLLREYGGKERRELEQK